MTPDLVGNGTLESNRSHQGHATPGTARAAADSSLRISCPTSNPPILCLPASAAANGALVDPRLAEILQHVALGVLNPEDAAVQLNQLVAGAPNVCLSPG
jgi:hypothetical protein